jgi:hypothetical protein
MGRWRLKICTVQTAGQEYTVHGDGVMDGHEAIIR